jgi:hypothetical protein
MQATKSWVTSDVRSIDTSSSHGSAACYHMTTAGLFCFIELPSATLASRPRNENRGHIRHKASRIKINGWRISAFEVR